MDFLNSKLIKDLEAGELPTIEVEISKVSILWLAASVAVAGMLIVMLGSVIKK